MNRDDLMNYVSKLEKDAREIFALAESIAAEKGDCDTLCEEFQIAAAVQEVFWKRAMRSPRGRFTNDFDDKDDCDLTGD